MKFVGKWLGKRFGLTQLRRAAKDQDGIAAVEFALVVPIAVVLLVGGIDYSDAISMQRKITLADRTVTDLVTQYTTINTATLALNLAASASIIAPYSSSNLVMTVSEVTTNAAGVATVVWSQSYNGVKRAIGTTLTLPVATPQANATLIFGEVQYSDVPYVGYALTGTKTTLPVFPV